VAHVSLFSSWPRLWEFQPRAIDALRQSQDSILLVLARSSDNGHVAFLAHLADWFLALHSEATDGEFAIAHGRKDLGLVLVKVL
jgi:hypothetical protein